MWWEDFLKVVGLPAVVGGVAGWIGKIVADRITEKERQRYRHEVDSKLQRLKEQIDRDQYVHQLQFETEFKTYRELWEKAVEVRRAALALRPIVDSKPVDKDEEDLRFERVKKLDDANQAFADFYARHKPFVANEVHDAADALNKAAYEEGSEFWYTKPRDNPNYWSEAQANAKKIISLADQLSDAIRNRAWPARNAAEPV